MKITINGNVIEGTPEELASYQAMVEDLARADSCEDACCQAESAKRDISQVKVGDKVRVIDAMSVMAIEAKNGEILEVMDVFNSDGEFAVMDVDGDKLCVLKSETHAFEIVAQDEVTSIITFEGEQYRKVDREAREGDVVVFNEEVANNTTYVTANKPYKVEVNSKGKAEFKTDGFGTYKVYRDDFGYNRTRETVDVYEPIAESKPKYEPKVGDIVVVTGNECSSRNSVGDIGKVYKIGMNSFGVEVPSKPKQKGVNGNATRASEMRPATAEEIAQYEKAVAKAKKPKLKAGDFVKFKESRSGITAGKAYEVITYEDGDLVVVDDLGLHDNGINLGKEYEILSADEAKWAKLGRKVGEYKVGDIISYEYAAPIAYYTVTRVEGDYVYFNSHEFGNDEEYMPSYAPEMKLVAPVESVLS